MKKYNEFINENDDLQKEVNRGRVYNEFEEKYSKEIDDYTSKLEDAIDNEMNKFDKMRGSTFGWSVDVTRLGAMRKLDLNNDDAIVDGQFLKYLVLKIKSSNMVWSKDLETSIEQRKALLKVMKDHHVVKVIKDPDNKGLFWAIADAQMIAGNENVSRSIKGIDRYDL